MRTTGMRSPATGGVAPGGGARAISGRALGGSRLLLALLFLAPAAGADCPDPDPSDLTTCGPLYTLPQWSTSADWDEPQYYETIQLADLDGDGQDELLGRGTAGLYVNRFDAAAGQWALLPQGAPASATLSFAALSDANGFDEPQYYETLETADFDGDGRPELYVRAAEGLMVFRWDTATNSFAQLGSTLAALSDANGYAAAPYYETIQAGDVDGDGADELLVRGPEGLLTFFWNASTKTFTQSPVVIAELSDAAGFDQPQYYRTIFTARAVAKNSAQIVARGANGLQMYWWYNGTYNIVFLDGPFRDAEGNDAPEYYGTLRAADLDGDGLDELIGRHASYGGALAVYSTATLAFVLLGEPFEPFTALDDPPTYETIRTGDVDGDGADEVLSLVNESFSPRGVWVFGWNAAQGELETQWLGGPEISTDVPWNETSNYSTLRTVRFKDRPGLGILIRGLYGVRTWVFNPDAGPVSESQVSFIRPQPYGYPPFTGAQADAYAALNAFLGIELGEVRDLYASANLPNTGTLTNDKGALEARCTDELTASPPSYGSCSPPPGSTVSAADWTAVSNEIIAELYWAIQVTDYFEDMNQILGEMIQNESGTFPSLATDLELNEAANEKAVGDARKWFDLTVKVVKAAAGLAGDGGLGPAKDVLFQLVDVYGSISDGSLGTASGADTVAKTYQQMQGFLVQQQEMQQDALEAQRRWVMGDLGLLRAVGTLVAGGVFTLDSTGMLSAGRQGFAVWAYQTFLPKIWSKYVVTGCKNTSGWDTVATSCTPPAAGAYMDGPSGSNFTAILDNKSGCSQDCFPGSPCIDSCEWTTPDATDLGILTNPLSSTCTYGATAASAWEYGCNVAVPTSDLFGNLNGWSFNEYNCQPGKCVLGTPAPGAADQGVVRGAGSQATDLRLMATVSSASRLDLRDVSVVVWRLLHDADDRAELLGDPEAYPLVLTPRVRTRQSALFATTGQKHARLTVQLHARSDGLGVTLQVRNAATLLPRACASGAMPRLWTEIQIRDGRGIRHDLSTTENWTCTRSPNGTWGLKLEAVAD